MKTIEKQFTVHDLPLSERPRERLNKFGAEALSVPELLALVLGRGTKGKSVIATSQELMQRFGNLKNLANASLAELSAISGIGPAKASQIKAVFELAKRTGEPADTTTDTVVKSPADVIRAVKNELKGKKKEHFMVLSLDTRNHLIASRIISMGSLDTSIAHPREVFLEAISNIAASVIFVHNHPSGNPEPSENDIKLTRKLIEVGKLLDIEVLDHIVVCDKEYISMKAKNYI